MDRKYILDSKDKKDFDIALGQHIVIDLEGSRKVTFRSKTKWMMIDYEDICHIATEFLNLSPSSKKIARFFDYLCGVSDLSDRNARDPDSIARIITDRATGKPSTGYCYRDCKRARLEVNLYRLSERIRPYNEALSGDLRNIPVTDSKDPKGEWESLKEQLKSFVTRNFDYGTSLLSSDKEVVDCMIHDLRTLLSDLSDLSDVPIGSTSGKPSIKPVVAIEPTKTGLDMSEIEKELERFKPKKAEIQTVEGYCNEWIKSHDPVDPDALIKVYVSDKGDILVFSDGRIDCSKVVL